MALRPDQIRAVQELAAAEPGLSLTKIAQRTKISRASVTTILRGCGQQSAVSGQQEAESDPDLVPPYRCRDCGHTVSYQPCKICQANRILDSTRTLRLAGRPRRAA